MIFFIIFLIIIIAILIFVIRNLIIQNNTMEMWINSVSSELQSTISEMKSIDDKQMFEKDDSVGVVFSQLHEILNKFQDRISDDNDNKNQNE